MTFEKLEKVKFNHIDYAGIVFYPRFLEMLNGIVEDWFEEALHSSFASMHKLNGIPTVDLKVQFKGPARLGETLKKQLWVNHLGESSVVCGFQYLNSKDKVCVQGEVTLVYVAIAEDRNSIQSAPFPAEMRSIMETYKRD